MRVVTQSLAALIAAFLIVIQKDESGHLLVNGHVSLAIVTIALLMYAIGLVSYELGRVEAS